MRWIEYIIIALVVLLDLIIVLPHLQLAHLRGLWNPEIDELKLVEWDYLTNNGEICFTYSYPKNTTARIYIDNQTFLTNKRNVCINISKKSKVRISIDDKQVQFFADNKKFDCRQTKNSISIFLPVVVNQYKKFDLNVTVFNGKCKGRVYRLNIYLDNKLERSIPIKMNPHERKSIKLNMRITTPGKHRIKVSIDNAEKEKEIYVTERFNLGFPLGLILFLMLLYVVFTSNLKDKLLIIFSLSLVYLVLTPLVFYLFGIEIFLPSLIVGIIMVIVCAMKLRY